MISNERIATYIHSLEVPESPVIEAIEQEALDTFVPIIRKETQSFLKVLLKILFPAFVKSRIATYYIDSGRCAGSYERTFGTL